MQDTASGSSGTAKKWLLGCGIGCGVVVIILVILFLSGAMWVKNIVEGFRQTETTMTALMEIYGPIHEFKPEADGTIRAERIETFMLVRDSSRAAREKLDASLRSLLRGQQKVEEDKETATDVFKMIGAGFGMVPQIAEFFSARNQALLDNDMGLGEYYYLYVIIYYSWLGNDPAEGADFMITGDKGIGFDDRRDDEEWRERRKRELFRLINRNILPMLENQLAGLDSSGLGQTDPDWRKKLAAEIAAMDDDPARLPWQEGLPANIEGSLGPYRSRLEESFSPMSDTIEIMTQESDFRIE